MLMQFQADISGVLIERSLSIETTSLGAAYLAGLGIGFWDSQNQIERLWQSGGLFLPNMNLSRRDSLRHYWLKAVERSLGWAARN
jgi:glycerol kinase